MNITYHGKQYKVIGFARSTVLPEEFILLRGQDEYLVAPTHDLSGITFGEGASSNEATKTPQ